ncbi:MAG: threonylcarbamoyl-AMP synthase [Nanoarchaeota archaeon]|nr:threonylcarbamoyl-AMP synthase [Nanoarchaeota archaeon]
MLRIGLASLLRNARLQKSVVSLIQRGGVVIYPTDTVYGIGCDATNAEAVQRLHKTKESPRTKPLSVIAPSKSWIIKNTKAKAADLRLLPGPYTLLLHKKRPAFLKHVAPGTTLGVRIPDHPISRLVKLIGVPLITTSANKSNQSLMTNMKTIPFEKGVQIVINGGSLKKKPSTIIDLTGKEPVVIERTNKKQQVKKRHATRARTARAHRVHRRVHRKRR